MTFQITVEPSGRTFEVQTNETILAAAIRQSIPLPYGCKDGACGSCKCQKLTGETSHTAYTDNALSDSDITAGFILTCCAHAHSDLVLESRQVASQDAFPIKKLPVRVQSLERASPDVMIVKLQLPANDQFGYFAGQYIEFLLRDGSRRAYSMATAPSQTGTASIMELHIRHLPGGKFTDHVFGAMKPKEILRIEGPFGSFFLREDSEKPIILLASGTGFAPIKALLQNMRAKNIQRRTTLYWGGRRPVDLYQSEWLAEQCATMPNLQFVPVVSNAEAQDQWTGRTGLVHQAVLQDHPDLSGHQVYACGAPIVIESALREYVTLAGLPAEEFYADAFTSTKDKAVASNKQPI